MSDNRGSMLLEVVIASAIVAVALLAIASMFPNAYKNVDEAGEDSLGATLAEQRIEWLRNQTYASLTAGTTVENLSDGHTRQTVIVDDTPDPGLKQVTVTVTTGGGRSVELTSLIADSD